MSANGPATTRTTAPTLEGIPAMVATARLTLTIAACTNGLLAIALTLLAVLVDRQADLLGTRSEAHGGFDPSVFPPLSGQIWLLTNGSALLAILTLVALITLRLAAGQVTHRRSAPATPEPTHPSANPADQASALT